MHTTNDPLTTCTSCGANFQPGWTYCGTCGASAPLAAPVPYANGDLTPPSLPVFTPPVAPLDTAAVVEPFVFAKAPKQKRNINKKKVAIIAGVFVLVAGLVTLVLNDLGTHSRLDKTRTALASTTNDLNSTNDSLSSMTSDRDRVKQNLDATNTELEGVRGSLKDANGRVTEQAGEIQALDTCLTGVANALSDITTGNYQAAISALNSVDSACQTAEAGLR